MFPSSPISPGPSGGIDVHHSSSGVRHTHAGGNPGNRLGHSLDGLDALWHHIAPRLGEKNTKKNKTVNLDTFLALFPYLEGREFPGSKSDSLWLLREKVPDPSNRS